MFNRLTRQFNPFSKIPFSSKREREGDAPSSYTGDPLKLHVRRAFIANLGNVFLDEGGGVWDHSGVYAVHTFDGSFFSYVEATSEDEALLIVMLARDFPIYVPHRARTYLEQRGVTPFNLQVSPELAHVVKEASDIRAWCLETFDSACIVDPMRCWPDSINKSADVLVCLPHYGLWFKNDNDAVLFKLRWGR